MIDLKYDLEKTFKFIVYGLLAAGFAVFLFNAGLTSPVTVAEVPTDDPRTEKSIVLQQGRFVPQVRTMWQGTGNTTLAGQDNSSG